MSHTLAEFNAVIDTIFATCDTNGDGKLDHGECLQAMQHVHQKFGKGNDFNHERFEEVFKKMDINGDGNIQKEELAEFVLNFARNHGVEIN